MRTVLVTGGTVRLGKAIAEELRARGWKVLASSHRPDPGADVIADLSAPDGAVRLYAETLRLLDGNPPDALVNNAALFTGDAATITAVNLEAPKKLTTLMAGRETGVGAVVNILDSVILGSIGPVGTESTLSDSNSTLNDPKRPYLASKRELLAFTRSAAAMFAATLRVNGVAPGPVLAPTDVHVKAGEALLDRRPASSDVAAAVSYLLDAESTTGSVIPVDAGQHLVK